MTTPADFRAEIARRQLRLYELAPRVGLHPTRLGSLLRGRLPMPPELAVKLQAAIESSATREEPVAR